MLKKTIFILIFLASNLAYGENDKAIFAGGCFWCMQSDFDKLPGVINTIVGYDGGQSINPTYEQVSSGSTNYAESVEVIYDPTQLSYQKLLNYYWHHIDPTAKDSQFCDYGRQYRSAIFYLNDDQQQQALTSLGSIKKQFTTVYTEITPSTTFYPAEDYHQKYYLKNPIRYEFYRFHCGRDARVSEVWNGKF